MFIAFVPPAISGSANRQHKKTNTSSLPSSVNLFSGHRTPGYVWPLPVPALGSACVRYHWPPNTFKQSVFRREPGIKLNQNMFVKLTMERGRAPEGCPLIIPLVFVPSLSIQKLYTRRSYESGGPCGARKISPEEDSRPREILRFQLHSASLNK